MNKIWKHNACVFLSASVRSEKLAAKQSDDGSRQSQFTSEIRCKLTIIELID